jgi:hypothetical protein
MTHEEIKQNIEQWLKEYRCEQVALAVYLECEPDDLHEEQYDHYGMTVYSLGSKEYAVGTDDEADEAWDRSLDSYIEEYINPQLDFDKLGHIADYIEFNEDKWKRDAKMDGRGHALSLYDGQENEQYINGETYYIYRIN